MIYVPMVTFAGCTMVLRTAEIQQNLNEAKRLLGNHTDPLWDGYDEALILFGVYMACEYQARGKPNKAYHFYNSALVNRRLKRAPMKRNTEYPPWVGDDEVHEAHRQALIKMDPEWYIRKFREVGVYGEGR